MPERATSRGTASDRLQRILYLLPAAGSEEGAAIEGLCDDLGVSRQVLLEDIAEVTAREYYNRAGSGDRLRVSLDPARVRVRTTGEFRRPPRLTAREKMALGLGLRVLASERDPEGRAALLELAGRLERELATVSEIEFAPPVALEEASASRSGHPDDAPGPGGNPGGKGAAQASTPNAEADTEGDADPAAAARGRLVAAARERVRCAFGYVKADAAEPEARRIEPYVVVASMGRWYAVGRDPDRDGIRAFRLDRMVDVTRTDGRFEPDPSFDLDRYLSGAYVYHRPVGGEDVPARVRYAPSIARWILEREEGEVAADGSAIVEHPVADPAWVARHVLQYGGDAELLGPEDLRARVAEGARRAERAHASEGTVP